MGKTIIQTIGPLYGESVNGTVFGRPNGSIYVPLANTIKIDLPDAFQYVRNSTSRLVVCSSIGGIPWNDTANQLKVVAESQDTQNYIVLELAESSDFSNVVVSATMSAGSFNSSIAIVATGVSYTIVNETSYYLRAVLYASSGVPVATSDTIEVTGWAS